MNLRRTLGLGCLLAVAVYGAEPVATFGTIRFQGGAVTPIRWLSAERVMIADGILLFSVGGTILRSESLPLHSLCLYQIRITTRRGPGTHNRFAIVFEDDAGETYRRQPDWQYADASRPNWFPFAPVLHEYVTGLILPANTKRVWLELAMDPPDKPHLAPYGSWELTRLEFAAGPAVAFGEHLGPNRLTIGDMETVTVDGQPAGWNDWLQAGDRIRVIEAGAGEPPAHTGRRFLRIASGPGILLGATEVLVQRGTAWRLSLWVRGRGQLQLMAQCLDDQTPVPLRIGDPQANSYVVDSPTWKQFERVWFAEAPGIHSAQIVIGVTAQSNVDLDAVEMRSYQK